MTKITLAFLIFIQALAAQAQKRDAQEDWSIADYFKNLPEKYITASGDYANGQVAAEKLVVDEKNGYAVQMDSQPDENHQPYPIFEMALFKSQNKPPLVVVANSINDHVCTDYETFFLRRAGNAWTEVKREVLPPLDLKMFWNEPQSAARFTKIVEPDNSTSYHFEPPRTGTRMKVSLEICDQYLEETPMKQIDELKKLMATTKSLYLDWDKQSGKFKLAK